MRSFSLAQICKFATSFAIFLPLTLGTAAQTETTKSKPVVLSVQMEGGKPIYKLDGKEVENRRDNSLLRNLTAIVNARGTKVPVFIIIDVRASLTEVGKLETALDKVDLSSDRRLFVSDFRDQTMNEIHWDHEAVPIPKD